MHKPLIALALLAAPLAAEDKPALAPSEIVAAAPKGDWTAIAASDLLVMDLAPDARGKPRRVVIQLMPPPFSAGWIGNIRTLARAHWWDGLSINRVQDNYVVQWGDADGEDKAKARALPAGLATVPESSYASSADAIQEARSVETDPYNQAHWRRSKESGSVQWVRDWEAAEKANIEGTRTSRAPQGWHERDAFAEWVELERGWPLAAVGTGENESFWPVHCYGMVGVGRNLSPDTGSGAELYTVIGHAPRHLDRNIALVGRVIEGIEHLSSLPRGTGTLGFYETPEERTKIASVRLASEMEVDPVPAYEYLSTESESFARYADARANRRDPFFIRPAGGADICNIPVPVRRAKLAH
ncbi:MAG TPA: peptidylprolyl isomerase [Novosphingobium sp.]|nr:peptidylprolyl isomerase [Novosphingobium sp.]